MWTIRHNILIIYNGNLRTRDEWTFFDTENQSLSTPKWTASKPIQFDHRSMSGRASNYYSTEPEDSLTLGSSFRQASTTSAHMQTQPLSSGAFSPFLHENWSVLLYSVSWISRKLADVPIYFASTYRAKAAKFARKYIWGSTPRLCFTPGVYACVFMTHKCRHWLNIRWEIVYFFYITLALEMRVVGHCMIICSFSTNWRNDLFAKSSLHFIVILHCQIYINFVRNNYDICSL